MRNEKQGKAKFWCWLFWHKFHPICEPISNQRTTVCCVRCAQAVTIFL